METDGIAECRSVGLSCDDAALSEISSNEPSSTTGDRDKKKTKIYTEEQLAHPSRLSRTPVGWKEHCCDLLNEWYYSRWKPDEGKHECRWGDYFRIKGNGGDRNDRKINRRGRDDEGRNSFAENERGNKQTGKKAKREQDRNGRKNVTETGGDREKEKIERESAGKSHGEGKGRETRTESRPKEGDERTRARSSTRQTTRGEDRGRETKRSETIERSHRRPKERDEKTEANLSTQQTTRGEDRGKGTERQETIERSHRMRGEIERVRSVSTTKGANRADVHKTADLNKPNRGHCGLCHFFSEGPVLNTHSHGEVCYARTKTCSYCRKEGHILEAC